MPEENEHFNTTGEDLIWTGKITCSFEARYEYRDKERSDEFNENHFLVLNIGELKLPKEQNEIDWINLFWCEGLHKFDIDYKSRFFQVNKDDKGLVYETIETTSVMQGPGLTGRISIDISDGKISLITGLTYSSALDKDEYNPMVKITEIKKYFDENGILKETSKEEREEKCDIMGAGLNTTPKEWNRNTFSFIGTETFDNATGTFSNGKATLDWDLQLKGKYRPITVKIIPLNLDEWIPMGSDNQETPGSYVSIKAILKSGIAELDKGAKFIYQLAHVSENRGVCLNWPPDNQAKEQYGLKFDHDKNKSLMVSDDGQRAESENGLWESIITISSYDYGAFGKLKVTVEMDDKTEEVSYEIEFSDKTKPGSVLSIPRDDNVPFIADAWSKDKGITGLNYDWDEAEIHGQNIKGDGLTLYGKYRGLILPENIHNRLEPYNKHLFVVDPGNLLMVDLWEKASDIKAIKLTEDLIKGGAKLDNNSRIVNFNYDGIKHKYAVRIDRIEDDDEFKIEFSNLLSSSSENVQNSLLNSFGTINDWCSSPKDATYCFVFVNRITKTYNNMYDELKYAVDHPESNEGKALRGWSALSFEEIKMVIDSIKNAVNNEESLEQVVMDTVYRITLHEVGHTCGVYGHEATNERYLGDLHCPMRYATYHEYEWMLIENYYWNIFMQPPFSSRFCETDFNCFSKLNVNDRK